MKYSIKRRAIALGLAATMIVPFALAGCDNGDKGGGGRSDQWVVTLNYNDGGEAYDRELYADKSGGSVKQPATPVREGYGFDGWYYSADGTGEEVKWDNFAVTEDVTLYAHWVIQKYPVTFDWNFIGSDPEIEYINYRQSVNANENGVKAPQSAPTNGDKRFVGWGSSVNSKAPDGDLNRPITRPTSYYGFWIDKDTDIFTVKYDLGYADAPEIPDNIYYGDISDSIVLPAPEREGYDFKGWTLSTTPADKGEYGAYSSFVPVTENGVETAEHEYGVTMKAVWEIKKWNIEFIDYNGNVLKTLQNREYGSSIADADKPADPTRNRCRFIGWYTLRTGGTKVEFPYTVKNGNALYARYQSELVETDVFDAEFVVIDPDDHLPGYSGATTNGYGMILQDALGMGASTAHAEDTPDYMKSAVYYASYLYKTGFSIVFTIECSEATTASLTLRAALESCCGADYTFSSRSGADNGYEVSINGTALDYGTFDVEADSFADYKLGTIRLNKGTNVIKLTTANATSLGGTTQAAAPIVDCIKITDHGSAVLSWRPEYDNLENIK